MPGVVEKGLVIQRFLHSSRLPGELATKRGIDVCPAASREVFFGEGRCIVRVLPGAGVCVMF